MSSHCTAQATGDNEGETGRKQSTAESWQMCSETRRIYETQLQRKYTKNLYYIHIMEYYSVIKKNNELLILTTRKKLKNTMLMAKARCRRVHIIEFYINKVREQAKRSQAGAYLGGRAIRLEMKE